MNNTLHRYQGLRKALRSNETFNDLINYIKFEIASIFCFFYDYRRYRKYSASNIFNRKSRSHEALVLIEAHRLEKGLSLLKPRRPFGESAINTGKYHSTKLTSKNFALQYHECVTSIVNNWNEGKAESRTRDFSFHHGVFTAGAIEGRERNHTRIPLPNIYRTDVFSSRFSCRQFDVEKKLTESEIAALENMTKNYPSVCNRNHVHIKFFKNGSREFKEAIELQKGGIPFAYDASHFAVFYSNIGVFCTARERSQAYVDIGIRAATFDLLSQDRGYSCCFLNWSTYSWQNKNFLRKFNFEDDVIIGTCMVIGYPIKDLLFAASPRS